MSVFPLHAHSDTTKNLSRYRKCLFDESRVGCVQAHDNCVIGISGDAGPMIKTEYAGDLKEWEEMLVAGIPSLNTGISEMWYLDRVAKICEDQPGGVDPVGPPGINLGLCLLVPL